ncbi:MAG: aspartate aminotransferase family protein, partial [Deltaproteobacteria bacterium]|nr:aspartate aminotransferase family protein [Deltaproteobacteria bacterium]
MSTTEDLYNEYLITSMVPGFAPIEVERASGTKYYGTDGREYLDCFSGISVTNAGSGHPKINAAAKEQIDKLVHCCTYVYYNPRAGELAKRMAEITPGRLQKSFFGSSGAEAIEGAMRLAKHYTGKNEILALTHSFHGRTNATLSITGNSGRKISGGPYLSGIAFAPAPHFYRCPFGSKTEEECGERAANYLADVIKYQTAGNVAAFVAEPILGEGGIITPPSNYFKLVKEILEENDILFICDEVQSGFGRTGKFFAIEHYGVDPDIMTTAKGIADGFPLSAFTATPEIGDAFTVGSHLSTFGGNPVSCAAALANIDVMFDEKLPENATIRGAQLTAGLEKIQANNKLVGDVRGKGLMIGIELVKDADKTPAAAEAA